MKFRFPAVLHLSIHVLVIINVVLLNLIVELNCIPLIRHHRHRFHSTEENRDKELDLMRVEEEAMSNPRSSRGCIPTLDCLSPPLPSRSNRTRRDRYRGNKGKCQEERQRLTLFAKRDSDYIPICRNDGSYAQVQCHLQTKSCWCVTREGRPIPGSSVLLVSPHDRQRLNCSKSLRQGKSTTRRRSSQGKHIGKPCNSADRSRFNEALITIFRREYDRYMTHTSTNYDSSDRSDGMVLSWKFDILDKNRDRVLHKNETLSLKKLVKQQIQPRSCAKNFISFCAKTDHEIERKEWIECLKLSPATPEIRTSGNGNTRRVPHPSQLLKPGGSFPTPSSSSPFSSSGRSDHEPPYNPLRSGSGITEVQETSNCWTDRQSALLASQIRNESVIIPECTVNGLYYKVQCAQGKMYCWCVEEDSGIQIPNTLVVNSVPDCNKRYSKPMKGCSGQKKQKFITDLLEYLMRKMTTARNNGGFRIPSDQRHMSVQEQAARWYFTQLDNNDSGYLERPEWKIFRAEVSKDKRLRYCGKKLPRHCDISEDRRLTMNEWVECLGVELLTTRNNQQQSANAGSHARRPVHRSNGRRNGKNPFTDILKQR